MNKETKFYEGLYTVRILSDREQGDVNSLADLAELAYQCNQGDRVGEVVFEACPEGTPVHMAELLTQAGSAPGFFQLEDARDLATDVANVGSLAGDVITEVVSLLASAPPVRQPTAFTADEMTTLLEFSRVVMSDAGSFDRIGTEMDIADDVMVALREKLKAVMDSDVPLFGETTVVVELIEQDPCCTVHPTPAAAMTHAVQCAMENLYAAEEPENPEDREESQTRLYDMLTEFDSIREGDYEVHILTPTNKP